MISNKQNKMKTPKGTVPKTFQSYLFLVDKDTNEGEILKRLNKRIRIADNPADTTIIKPTGASISIEEVRALKKQIYQRPVSLSYKLVIIKDADQLTHEAQNALLKILEEPPAHAIIVLTTNSQKNLLPTVVSRLTLLDLQVPQTLARQKALPTNLKEALTSISQIDNPKLWIDNELTANYQSLLESLNSRETRTDLEKNLRALAEVKKMVSANVNPKFAILSYLLRTSMR